MKLCHQHEDKLRIAISGAGLDRFINGPVETDPLLASRYALTVNAMVTCGARILAADSPPCPLCYLVTNVRCTDPKCTHESHDVIDAEWIKLAVAEQRKRFDTSQRPALVQ